MPPHQSARPSAGSRHRLRTAPTLWALCTALLLAVALVHLSATGSWQEETQLPSAIQEVSVAALNNLVYVVGGSVSQVRSNQNLSFDPGTHSWSTHAPYPGTARDHMGLVANGGFLYLMGGVTAWPQPSVATVQRYDPSTDTWTTLAPLPVARGAMGVAVINGKIYAAGGLEAGVSVADFTVYDPATNAWSSLPSMPTARDHLTGATLNGKFYAIGGRNGNTCAPLTTVEVFDPSTNTWSTAAPMQNARGGHATATANGHIQVFGGEGAPSTCGIISSAEEYDPLSNTWASLPSMPTPRHGTGGGLINASIYIPAGATASGDAATAIHERFDDTTALGALPSPWSNTDVGATGAAGSAGASGGTFTVEGAGSDIWGSADSFQFVYQQMTGDGQITARVLGLENTSSFAKAGVMIRGTLSAGSAHAILDMKPAGGLEFMTRSTSGGATSFIAGTTATPPPWVRLTRSGTTISAAWSTDGATWTPIGTTTLTLPTTVYVGLAVTSHTSGVLALASFDNVSASGGSTADLPPTVSIISPASGASYTAPATIPITASASDADGTVTKVDFFANGTLIGTSTTSPYTFSWTNVAAGAYSLTAVATDNAGLQTTSSAVSVSVTGSSGALPSPWANQDIGSTGAVGSASYTAGTFTIQGSGADIWGTSDAFQYVYQPLNGDGQITARLTGIQNTNSFAKIGVMIRQSLTAGSAHVILDLKASGGLEFMDRPSDGATTTFITGTSATPPAWVRLSRSGSSFVAFTSPDGSTWTQLGSASVTMTTSVYVGLAVTSHSTGALATGTADNVTVGTSVADVPPTVTLTSPANGATYTAPATVNLAANAADADGTVTRVDFYANSALVGTAAASPYTATWSNVAAGTYSIAAVATDNAGLQTTSSAVSITVGSSSPGPLPSPWTDRDIGSVGLKGSATYASGVFTVNGAGSDIWGTADSFNFVYQPLSADGQITARVTGVQNTNAFAKAGVMIRQALTAGSAHVILDLKPAGGGLELMTRAASGGSTTFITSAIAKEPVWVRLVRSGSTVGAYTSMDGTSWAIVGSTTTSMTGTVYVGLAVTSHSTSTLNTSTFDNVSVGPPSVTPPASLSFASRAIAAAGSVSGAVSIPNLVGPTSLTIGPDGRLYVSTVSGRLFLLTYDATKLAQAGQLAVTHVQEIDAIYLKPSIFCNIGGNLNDCQLQSGQGSGRQVTGILIDPKSTASQVTLYVSNSNLGSSTIDYTVYPFSGTITRLILQPDSSSPGNMKVTGNTDLVVGIPRSREAHSPNGMVIGPDGWLYLAEGGNTNAGQPSSFFGNLPDYYLSASLLRLNLGALPSTLPIDVTNVRTASDMTPFTGVFELYATGFRNPYDLVWHSNGKLYINDNGANSTQGNTAGPTDGCSNTPSIDPGDQDDGFFLVSPGKYYGHPTPPRGQCVFADGTVYSPPIAPDPNWVPPLFRYAGADSSDGVVEYTATAFGGALQHNLIVATFSDDEILRRVTLSADGSAVEGVIAIGKYNQPLDVWTDSAGNIFVAEYTGNQISVLTPK